MLTIWSQANSVPLCPLDLQYLTLKKKAIEIVSRQKTIYTYYGNKGV